MQRSESRKRQQSSARNKTGMGQQTMRRDDEKDPEATEPKTRTPKNQQAPTNTIRGEKKKKRQEERKEAVTIAGTVRWQYEKRETWGEKMQ